MSVVDIRAFLIVRALVDAPVAWRSVDQLARDTKLDPEVVADTVADLDVAGLFATWEVEGVPRVTFSPLGAAMIGARLIEVGPDEVPRWALRDKPDPPAPRALGVFRSMHCLDSLADPAPSPEVVAELAELAELVDTDRRKPDRSPSRFVGYSSPWPVAAMRGACPVCGSPSRPTAYCLYCDSITATNEPRDLLPFTPRAPKPRNHDRAAARLADHKARRRALHRCA